ncbi:MAG: ABC transporter ATP-binding protein/permease [Ignavibacteria bacterium]|nr:ABC transporter ATP-binding protein/permease [Ignavibacteria bacterium]
MKSLLNLLPYVKKYRKKLLLGFIFIILSISFSSMFPLIVGNGIDALRTGVTYSKIIFYSLTAIASTLTGGFFLFLVRQNIIVVSREIENDLRHDFFSHIVNMPKDFFNKNSTGSIMALATNDINAIREFVGPGIMYTIQTFYRTLLTVSIMFYINPFLALVALSPLPFISFIVYKVGRMTHSRSLKVKESFSDLTSKAQENISGIRVVKSYAREAGEIAEFQNISRDYFRKNLSLAKVQSFSFPMMYLLTGVSLVLVIYFGGIEIINNRLTLGNMSTFLIYLGLLTWPMIAFGWIINLTQRAAPSMERLMNIMKLKPEISDNKQTDFNIAAENIEGEVEFKNVSFKYPAGHGSVLKNINLKISKGTTLGIIGHTGSGKTTLINLLSRIYDISEGEILIDGIPIKKIPLNTLRESIGVVPQESFLFSTTIEKNISYSKDYLDYDKVIESAKSSSLYKDVCSFPEKFQTVVGERGITLSGGQKQRTSIARAIYKNPKILILDDSLSAVDTHTEEEILNELKQVMRNRTSIIISHRISSIKNANNIIVLSGSVIKEQGTHNELISLGGIYYDIYQKQLLEEEIQES